MRNGWLEFDDVRDNLTSKVILTVEDFNNNEPIAFDEPFNVSDYLIKNCEILPFNLIVDYIEAVSVDLEYMHNLNTDMLGIREIFFNSYCGLALHVHLMKHPYM